MLTCCDTCTFPLDPSQDIYCSGCGSRVALLEVVPDAAVFFAGPDGSARDATVEIVLRNRSSAVRAVEAVSRNARVSVAFEDESAKARILPTGTARLNIRLLGEERVERTSAYVDTIEIHGELGLIAKVSVSVALAPDIVVRYAAWEGDTLTTREASLRDEVTTIGIALPREDPTASLNTLLSSPRVTIAPAGRVPLQLAQRPAAAEESQERWLSFETPESLQLRDDAPLTIMIDAIGALVSSDPIELSAALEFVGLGARKLVMNVTSLSEPALRVVPLTVFVDEAGALQRHSTSPVELRYELINDETRAVVFGGCEVAPAGAFTGPFGVDLWQSIEPGESVTLVLHLVPALLGPLDLPRRGTGKVELESFEFELAISTLWNRNDGAKRKTTIVQSVDFRLPRIVEFVGLDFGTSNTCLGFVDSAEALYESVCLAGDSPRATFEAVIAGIELVDLDPHDTLGFELPSAIRVVTHSSENRKAPTDVLVGEQPYREMVISGYAARIASMMKRGLPDDGLGRTVLDDAANSRHYRWSLLVEGYLRRAFRALLEEKSVWPRRVTFSYPGTWQTRPEIGVLLEETIRAALAGGPFVPDVQPGLCEAEALAVFYANRLASDGELPSTARTLDMVIFDCGGGTTDISVLRLHGEEIFGPQGQETVWVTQPQERAACAVDRGGEDLTLEFARIIHAEINQALASNRPKSKKESAEGENEGVLSSLKERVRAKAKAAANEGASEGAGASEPILSLAPLPDSIMKIASGRGFDSEDKAVFERIVASARTLKVNHYGESAKTLPIQLEVQRGQSRQTVKAAIPNRYLSQRAGVFVERLIQDSLRPTVESFHQTYGFPDVAAVVLCGNSTKHPAFHEKINEFVDRQEEASRVARSAIGVKPTQWFLPEPGDERKANLVRGLLVDALHATEELDGGQNPLVDALEALPVRSASVEQHITPAEATAGSMIRLVVGQSPVEKWCNHRSPDGFVLQSKAVRATHAHVEVLTAPSERGPWVERFREQVGDPTSILATQLAELDGAVRQLRFTLAVEGDTLNLSWEATRSRRPNLPGGMLCSISATTPDVTLGETAAGGE
ncbi:MAG: hypothetical protein ACJAYU_005202 [Bradymonadia bacterium]|jgi:hypothetical protein